jgi:hypothetical protein
LASRSTTCSCTFLKLLSNHELTWIRYFFVTNLATNEEDVIRYAALLRGTESGWQALSYGLTSLPLFAQVGGVYANFLLWGISIFPAWLVLQPFGSEGAVVHLEDPATIKASSPDTQNSKEKITEVNEKQE